MHPNIMTWGRVCNTAAVKGSMCACTFWLLMLAVVSAILRFVSRCGHTFSCILRCCLLFEPCLHYVQVGSKGFKRIVLRFFICNVKDHAHDHDKAACLQILKSKRGLSVSESPELELCSEATSMTGQCNLTPS